MVKFSKTDSLSDFQGFIEKVYAIPDDRLYSLEDLLTHQQRFAMRAMKGIRKENTEKLKTNLLISFAWVMATANRLHIDVEKNVWWRFPMLCSYCGNKPCQCKIIKPKKRMKVVPKHSLKPKTLAGFQKMFEEIYPTSSRSLVHAGIHLAEEAGEVSEAVHNFIGQHQEKQFAEIPIEIADFVSCIFGVANSAGINMAEELASMFTNGCHVCHMAPCVCKFAEVASLRS